MFFVGSYVLLISVLVMYYALLQRNIVCEFLDAGWRVGDEELKEW